MWISFLESSPSVARIIIVIALMLFLGYAMTRITKKLKLPNVTAYIVTGILIGPYCLNLIPASVVSGMSFLADIALALIAFSTGEYFRFDVLKKNGPKVMIITVLEALMASLLVFIAVFFFLHMDISFSIVLAALAAATAPASTMMTIRQTHAKGDFVDTLLQVVALDDAVGLIEYSVAISIALAAMSGRFEIGSVLQPILLNLAVVGMGIIFGMILFMFMRNKHSSDNRLIITLAVLFSFCGICALLDVSPLLGVMCMSTVYINITGDDRLFKQMNYFSPPLLLLFFVRSGVSFNLSALFSSSSFAAGVPLLAVGIIYFAVRIAGKYAGAYLGCAITGKSEKVKKYLGLALIPQAGVAIGLAALGARTLGGEAGSALETIILSSSILYELIGPACAKASLYLSGSYSNSLDDMVPDETLPEEVRQLSPAEQLAEKIRRIQEELDRENQTNPFEDAFTEEAEEYEAQTLQWMQNPGRRRL